MNGYIACNRRYSLSGGKEGYNHTHGTNSTDEPLRRKQTVAGYSWHSGYNPATTGRRISQHTVGRNLTSISPPVFSGSRNKFEVNGLIIALTNQRFREPKN